MINTNNVCRNNSFIANDYYKGELNNTEFTRSQKPIFTKKKTIETRSKEASERRYTRRSNICSECNMAMENNHECF